VLGQYRLDELERDLGSDQFGEVVRNLGMGGYLDHARNDLERHRWSPSPTGLPAAAQELPAMGASTGRRETISDKLSEWTMVDSPTTASRRATGEDLELNYVLKSRAELESCAASAYVQNAWTWETRPGRSWGLNAGAARQHGGATTGRPS
jgi:hypothetical protein